MSTLGAFSLLLKHMKHCHELSNAYKNHGLKTVVILILKHKVTGTSDRERDAYTLIMRRESTYPEKVTKGKIYIR